MTINSLLSALHADPADLVGWQALADLLEEHGEAERAELLRLDLRLRALGAQMRGRRPLEARMQQLLAAGVVPCRPRLVNTVGMELGLVPSGLFLVDLPRAERERRKEARPPTVEITRPFYLGTHPVTQAQYQRVTDTNPAHFAAGGEGWEQVVGLDTRAFPVEGVSWDDAVAFCAKLSGLWEEKAAGRVYRLPTEAEWEYACRAGTSTAFHYGNNLSSTQANFNGDHPYGQGEKGPSLDRTCAVGSYLPNAWGLYDMHGNVWEWCADWYTRKGYEVGGARDPVGPVSGSTRVLRGGAWGYIARCCRSAYRHNFVPAIRYRNIGFRVVCAPAGPG